MLIYQLITRKGFTYKEFFTSTRPGVNGLPQDIATKTTLSMSISFTVSLVTWLHAHRMFALWTALQHCGDGDILGLSLWTNLPQLFTKFSTSASQPWPTTMLLSLGKRIPVMAKKAKRKMLELKCICHISHFEWMCLLVWSTELVRGGFYRELEGKIRMKLTIWGGESFKEHNKKS